MALTPDAVRRSGVRLGAAAATALLVAGSLVPSPARAVQPGLPLGDSSLSESRTTKTLAPGVTLTTIVRTTLPGDARQLPAASRGPWRINLLRIDPKLAKGHLRSTYGANIAQTETTSQLVREAGALAGVNSSFFTFGKNPKYPGDPVGLGVYGGHVRSDPAAVRPEVDLLVDARSGEMQMDRMTWLGSMRNRSTKATLILDHLDHPPVVPSRCTGLSNPTNCRYPGEIVLIHRSFGPTPKGKGVEVVIDRSGCVVRTTRSRGTKLASGQRALQATGTQAAAVLDFTRKGCLTRQVALFDSNGIPVPVTDSTFGVTGRYRLTEHGEIVVPSSSNPFFNRNPRTIAGLSADGRMALMTIDGRSSSSVGATLAEAAAVAHALNLSDAINLDGGGSTTMVANGKLVNRPSGGRERAVGDALVYVDKPFPAKR